MTDPVYKTEALIAQDIDAYLESHQNKSLLRFITCGSVDDGKSTLIGCLLYDSKMIFEDQLAQERDVKGLYAKACSGQLKNFTGIDSPYEAPETPEIHIDTTTMSIDEAAEQTVRCVINFFIGDKADD